MHPTAAPATATASADTWAPSLGPLRLVGNGRSVAVLSPEASVVWWCAPEFDDPPLCWRLLDPAGGAARFPDLELVEADDTPAGVSTTTLLRDAHGLIEVRDSVLPRDDGVLLVRLLRRRTAATPHVIGEVRHELRLGGFDGPHASWALHTDVATATLEGHDRRRTLQVRGGRQEVRDGALHSSLAVDTVREIEAAGRRGVGISVDVADSAALEAAADRVEDALGPIDLWVNDAFTGAIAFFHRGIDHYPMPVPPIYQPEVAARAVAHVAAHPRRTMWVGLPTVLTILGNRVAPALLDHFLARTNVEGQQSPDHDPPSSKANTWEPVYGSEVQARGTFDDKAYGRSPELWLSEHRVLALVGTAGAAAAALALRAGHAANR